MTYNISYRERLRWIEVSLTWGVLLGVLVGCLRGIALVVDYDYVYFSTLTAASHALRSQLNETLFWSVLLFLAPSVVFTVCHSVCSVFARQPGPIAAVATSLLLGWLPLWYQLNKADWFPAFWSVNGIVTNAALWLVVGLLGVTCWKLLQKLWSPGRERAFSLPGKRAARQWALAGCALAWLAVNVSFFIVAPTVHSAAERGTTQKILLIGLDGLDWRVINPLLQQGKLPHLRRLMESGISGPLATMQPTRSPVIWTTVATGKPMSEHGITDFLTEGKGQIMTSKMRQSKALWNILSDQDVSVGVVGWWATWPAEAVKGFVVSPYASLKQPWRRQITHDIPHQTYPEELIREIEPIMTATQARQEEACARLFPVYDPTKVTDIQRAAVEDTCYVLLADEMNAQVGLHLWQTKQPDFLALYFNGTDVVGHRFWKYMEPDALSYRLADGDVAMFGEVVRNYYIVADEWIGRFLEEWNEETTVILMSDHGMAPYMPEDRNDDWVSAHHHEAPPGVIIMAGGPVKRGPLARASVFDLTPTVLYLAGLPIGRDMAGFPLTAALQADFVAAHPPSYIGTYEDGEKRGAQPGQEEEESDMDHLLKERLRSLGYL